MSIRRLLSTLLLVSLAASAGLAFVPAAYASTTTPKSTATRKTTVSTKKKAAVSKSRSAKGRSSSKTKGKAASKRERAAVLRRLKRMNRAFVASADLKPMARQLLQNRTKPAYKGVEAYARRHAGTDAGAMAYMVDGYAHLLDHDYAEAIPPLKKAHARVDELSDYTDYFLASAYSGSSQPGQAIAILKDFETKHSDSLFLRDAVVSYANALVATNRPQEAMVVLEQYRKPERADVNLAIARAYLKAGQSAQAAELLGRIYFKTPLSGEASDARADLDSLASAGVIPPLSFADRKQRADLLAEGRRWGDAAREYRALLDMASPEDRPVVQAALGMSLHRSGNDKEARELLEGVAESGAEYDAQRLLALAEMARSGGDEDRFKDMLSKLRQNHTSSPYFEEALLLGGNMYLLKKDYDRAIDFYREMQQRFPAGRRASYVHWKAAWLSLRQGRNDEAKKLFEEQVEWYPTSAEVPAAIYWRARLAEEGNEAGKARAWYRKLAESYRNYYYADLARVRLAQLGTSADTAVADPILEKVAVPIAPDGSGDSEAPADDLRAQKARLLENAGMVDFAVKELRAAASEGGAGWASAEIARMYRDLGRYDRALQTLKRAVPSYYALEFKSLPRGTWEGLFPRPYWNDLRKYAEANDLDPYLVASLVRQESEFNPGAVSNANAFGLMQLLPGTGRTIARSLRVRGFQTESLLSATTNLQLGTRFFRDLLDRYSGRLEYALAAYNAGAERVDGWLAEGKYRDPQEFVESIPFTETREYVQAIMRNASIYHQLYADRSAPIEASRAEKQAPADVLKNARP